MAVPVPAISDQCRYRDGDQHTGIAVQEGSQFYRNFLKRLKDGGNTTQCNQYKEHFYPSAFLAAAIVIRTAGEQSEQRSEQDASAQEAAMVTVMMMVAMAMTATKDQVPKTQDSKQTQHFVFLRLVVQYVPVIWYVYRITGNGEEIQDRSRRITADIFLPEQKYA